MLSLPGPVDPLPATRFSDARWRDPRLIAGVLIMAGSVLLGAWAVPGPQDAVAVWTLREALPAGARLTDDDLLARSVTFPGSSGDRYLTTSTVVAGETLARPVGAGELLPAAALAAGSGPGAVHLPLPADAVVYPSTVRPGSVVDVWVSPEKATGTARARRVLREVTVIEIPGPRDPLAPSGPGTILIAVPAEDDLGPVLGDVLAATARTQVVLTVRSGR